MAHAFYKASTRTPSIFATVILGFLQKCVFFLPMKGCLCGSCRASQLHLLGKGRDRGWPRMDGPSWKFLADSPSWMVQCGCSWLDGLGWMIPAVWSRLDSPSWMITTGWSGLNALSWMNPAGWSHWMEDVGWAWLEQVVPAWSSSVLVSAGVLLLPCQYTVLSFRFRLRMVLITCWCFGFLLNHVYPKQGPFSSCLMLFQQGGRQKNKLGGSTARPGDLS